MCWGNFNSKFNEMLNVMAVFLVYGSMWCHCTKTCRTVATHELSGPVLFMLTRKALLDKIKTALKLEKVCQEFKKGLHY